jgi:hypothetical protein
MNDKLSSFLVDLASDPEKMSRFVADPHSLLVEADLTDNERAAVLSRDSRRLGAALGAVSESNGNVQNITDGNVQNVSIGNVQNVTVGNVQNVSIGNVQNFSSTPTWKGPKKAGKKPAKKPGSKNK